MLTTILTTVILAGGPTIITENAKLYPNDAAQWGGFGAQVVVDGDTAVMTSPGNDFFGLDAGAAWIFHRNTDGEFEQTQILAGDDTGFLDSFGYSVALQGERLVVGARYHIVGGLVNAGSAYIFERGTDGLFVQVSQLVAPSPALDEAFGWSIDLDGDRIVVGARNGNAGAGAAYVYVRASNGSWSHESTLSGGGIDAGDEFAKSVSIVGDRVACGAPYYAAGCSGSNRCGSVFIFERDGSTWDEVHRLTPNDLANEDYFGYAVDLADGRLLATSVYDDDMGPQSGSGYIFEHDGSDLAQTAKLVAPDGQWNDFMGMCGQLEGDRVVMGGWYGNDGRGAAWLFEHDGADWAFLSEAWASDGENYDIFGRAVSMDGDTLMVGADWADVDGVADAGAVYVYDLAGNDQEGACCTNGTCVSSTASLCAYFGGVYQGDDTDCSDADCTSCMGDVDHDGAVTVDDLLTVISQFGPCP